MINLPMGGARHDGKCTQSYAAGQDLGQSRTASEAGVP